MVAYKYVAAPHCEEESQLKEQAGSELVPVHEQAHARNIGRGAEPPVVSGISTAYSGFAGGLQTSPCTSPVELTRTLPVMYSVDGEKAIPQT